MVSSLFNQKTIKIIFNVTSLIIAIIAIIVKYIRTCKKVRNSCSYNSELN